MRALDIAVLVWTFQISLFIVGSLFGVISVPQPEPLITMSDINNVLMGGSVNEIALKIIGLIIGSLIGAVVTTKLMGLSAGQVVLTILAIAMGLFFLWKTLYYALNLGTLLNDMTNSLLGIQLADSIVWSLNAVMWVIGFLAVIDVWRGIRTRNLG